MKKTIYVVLLIALAILLGAVALKLSTENSLQKKVVADLERVTGVAATTTAPNTAVEQVLPNQVATSSTSNTIINKKMNQVTIQTSMGTIVVELGSNTPKTTENFTKLATSGFYDGVKFHRVIKGFMIQSGDPQSKDESLRSVWGTGGPGYKFADELSGKETYPQGTLAMANSGPNTNGSQFFIVSAANAPLPPSYTVFGKVISGLDTVIAIENVPTGAQDKPVTNVTIQKMTVK
jgi:cyclophilin family peptidyl-prolyl cis-trans isomerase